MLANAAEAACLCHMLAAVQKCSKVQLDNNRIRLALASLAKNIICEKCHTAQTEHTATYSQFVKWKRSESRVEYSGECEGSAFERLAGVRG